MTTTTYTMTSTGITYTITAEMRTAPTGQTYAVATVTAPSGRRSSSLEHRGATLDAATNAALAELSITDSLNRRSDDEVRGIVRPGITAALSDARYTTIYDEA